MDEGKTVVAGAFTKEELDLLAHGFGYFLQEFNHEADDPARALQDKIYRMLDEAEAE